MCKSLGAICPKHAWVSKRVSASIGVETRREFGTAGSFSRWTRALLRLRYERAWARHPVADRPYPCIPLLLVASKDLQPILADWPFDPSGLSVRAIEGEDGVPKIQLRIDLGVMQMNRDGRPDGQSFDGAETLLDFCRLRQREHDAAYPDAVPYQLDSMACSELMREGAQFYHRYICFWRLGWYELCARDTRRNLRLFDFVQRHAAHERDKRQFDQWRPYVTMMHARAVATPLIELRQWEAALGAITAGIESIEEFLDERGQRDQAEQVSELVSLRRWREEVEELAGADGPSVDAAAIDPVTRLVRELEKAVAEERYEEASRLRDQIANLGGPRAPFDPHDADPQP